MLFLEICRKEWLTFLKSKVLLSEILFIFAFTTVFPWMIFYGLSQRAELSLQAIVNVLAFLISSIVAVPATCAVILAADVFAGEKERKTLETLLALPVPESKLYFGKTFAIISLIFALSSGSLMLSTFLIKNSLERMNTGLEFPTPEWILSGFVLALIFIILSTSLAAVVSMYVGNVREASFSIFMVLVPLIGLGIAQVFFNVRLDADFLIRFSIISFIVAFGLLMLGAHLYKRDVLILA